MAYSRKSRRRSSTPWEDPRVVIFLILALVLIFSDWSVRILVLGVLALGMVIFYIAYQRKVQQERLIGMDQINRMTGPEFEEHLWFLFKDLGYAVERTPVSKDWGADLIISKGGIRTAVQAKRYSKPVDPAAVQEVVAAKAKYHCSHALVVTNSTYTAQAYGLAHLNGVELWDGERLGKELLRRASKE